MDKPWAFNHKTKKAFTVISPIDINKPEYQVDIFNFRKFITSLQIIYLKEFF